MFKKIITVALGIIASLALTAQVSAANMNVRIEQPKSPTKETNLNINVVVLDNSGSGSPITVKCFKVGTPDTQFGSDIAVSAGGNSINCQTNSSVLNGEGTVEFYATATNGSETVTSSKVSVTIDTTGPGDVRDYNKAKTNSCEYTIHFKTAPDSGQTAKVEVYRSDVTPFYTDHNSRVGTVPAGSNEVHDFTNTPSDCSKTYYYAVRAFDSAGNGSAVVGDSETHTTVINPTTTQQAGAIPVTGQGSVLGKTTSGTEVTTPAEAAGETLGDTSPSAETLTLPPSASKANMSSNARNLVVGGVVILVGALLWLFWKRTKQQPQ